MVANIFDSLKTQFQSAIVNLYFYRLNVKKVDLPLARLNVCLEKFACRKSVAYKVLDDENYWAKLNTDSGFTEAVKILQTTWQQISPFALATTAELIAFKRDIFDNTEHALLLAMQTIEYDLKRIEISGIWHPAWLTSALKQEQDCLRDSHQNIKHLQEKMQATIQLKATLYLVTNKDKYGEDIFSDFIQKLRKLNIANEALPLPEPSTTQITDDHRIWIYDYLSSENSLPPKDLDAIIRPINKKPFRPLRTESDVVEEFTRIKNIKAKFERALNLTAISAYQKQKEKNQYTQVNLDHWIIQPAKKYLAISLEWSGISSLWRRKWWISLAISMSLYLLFAPIAITFIQLHIGIFATNTLSNLMFWGVVLLPAYKLGWDFFKSWAESIYDIFSHSSKQTIQHALETLEQTQIRLSTEYACGISDIERFDISQLEYNTNASLVKIERAIQSLSKPKGLGLLVDWGTIKQARITLLSELEIQKHHVKQRRELFATHICERLDESLVQLQFELDSQQLVPSFPKNQIQKLFQFLKQHGSAKDKERFKRTTNIIPLFIKQLIQRNCLLKTQYSSKLKQPWGGYDINHPRLRGWETLINHYTLDEEQKSAANQIIRLLRGELEASSVELNLWISIIVGCDEQAALLANIQNHLFLTLNQRPDGHAKLLSQAQQNLIQQWYSQNKNNIVLAKKFIDAKPNLEILNDWTQKVDMNALVDIFEALEGYKIYQAIKGNDKPILNPIKEKLDHFKGDCPEYAYLIKFIPEELKLKYLKLMANQRLSWLMAHIPSPGQNVFTEADRELFLHPYLHDTYDFEEAVQLNTKFSQPYCEDMQRFLQKAVDYGLIRLSLLNEYISLNERINSFTQSLNLQYSSSLQGSHPILSDSTLQEDKAYQRRSVVCV